jgi:hypothetical protein
VAEVARRLLDAASDVSGMAQLKLAYLAVDLAKELIGRWGRRKVAVLVDEVFQAVGLDKAGLYVKSLLKLIEYPLRSNAKIITIADTSVGVTKEEISRHLKQSPSQGLDMGADAPMLKAPVANLTQKSSRPAPSFNSITTGPREGLPALLHKAKPQSEL